MTDMHCHILPCVDDGAGSVEEACSMAWKAWENGTKRIIATPHFCRPDQRRRRSVQEYRRYVYLLQQGLRELGCGLELRAGMEVFATAEPAPTPEPIPEPEPAPMPEPISEPESAPIPDALTYDEEPVTFRQSLVQRRRWCSGVMSVAGRYLPRLWRRVPSRNFFYCLDFAVFLSMPMVQVLALLPGLWAVAQAVLLENWLALALSLASFWGGMTLTALALALAGRRKLRPLWKSILLYPLFTASWYPLHILAVFRKTKVWKPIAHRGQTARQLESSVR